MKGESSLFLNKKKTEKPSPKVTEDSPIFSDPSEAETVGLIRGYDDSEIVDDKKNFDDGITKLTASEAGALADQSVIFNDEGLKSDGVTGFESNEAEPALVLGSVLNDSGLSSREKKALSPKKEVSEQETNIMKRTVDKDGISLLDLAIETTKDGEENFIRPDGSIDSERFLRVSTRFSQEVAEELATRYDVDRKLAHGAYGDVILMHDKQLDMPVVMKVIKSNAVDKRQVRRFLNEAKILGKFFHPNIVRIFDAKQDVKSGQVEMIQEYVEGQDLKQLLESDSSLKSTSTFLRIFSQVADGLAAAHKKGVLHRDVKPANILVSKFGDAKIADFGLALSDEMLRRMAAEEKRAAKEMREPEYTEEEEEVNELSAYVKELDPRITQSGQLMGTPLYMSPEQAEADQGEIGPETDVYSLGATMYQAFTGKFPFTAKTAVEIVEKIIHGKPKNIFVANPDIPKDIAHLILDMMRKDFNTRPTMEQVMKKLVFLHRKYGGIVEEYEKGAGQQQMNLLKDIVRSEDRINFEELRSEREVLSQKELKTKVASADHIHLSFEYAYHPIRNEFQFLDEVLMQDNVSEEMEDQFDQVLKGINELEALMTEELDTSSFDEVRIRGVVASIPERRQLLNGYVGVLEAQEKSLKNKRHVLQRVMKDFETMIFDYQKEKGVSVVPAFVNTMNEMLLQLKELDQVMESRVSHLQTLLP